jgi:hypothetical protein
MTANLEHVNLTVTDPKAFADVLCKLFDWKIRWQGTAINNGFTVHVGTDADYLALYTGPGGAPTSQAGNSYSTQGGLNHIGIVVDDLDAVEAGVKLAGFKAYSHAEYEPGKRFYFQGPEGIPKRVFPYKTWQKHAKNTPMVVRFLPRHKAALKLTFA